MHPLTMRFGSAALEARYRKHIFNETAKIIIECLAATDAAVVAAIHALGVAAAHTMLFHTGWREIQLVHRAAREAAA